MAPALFPGDFVVAIHTTRIRRGDIVVLRHPTRLDVELVKRVVGLPYERVDVTGGAIAIDGVAMPELGTATEAADGSWDLEDELFVLGDNRAASTEDSRNLGGIPVESGVWRVVWRYWPPRRTLGPAIRRDVAGPALRDRQPRSRPAAQGSPANTHEEYGGSTVDMVVRKDVAAPADVVWAIITDLDRSPEIITGIDGVERLDTGSGFDVGTRWRETRTMFGREATEEMEVTALDPGRSYTVEADGHNVHYVSTLSLEPTEGGTRITMSFTAQPDGLISKVLANTVGRLMIGTTRKALQRDLEDIAAAAAR